MQRSVLSHPGVGVTEHGNEEVDQNQTSKHVEREHKQYHEVWTNVERLTCTERHMSTHHF